MMQRLEGLQANMFIDRALLASSLALLLIGLVMIASASIDIADVRNNDPFFYFSRHGTFILLGVAVALTAYFVPLSWWEKNAWFLLAGSLFLLSLV